MLLQKIVLIVLSALAFSTIYAHEKSISMNSKNLESKILKSEKLMVVKFFGSWCPTLDIELDEMPADDMNAVEFVSIDIAGKEEKKLARKYGIKGVPTILYFKNGQKVGQTVGYMKKRDIQPEVKKMIEQYKNLEK